MQAQGRGLVTKPKKLSSLGTKRLMGRASWAQGFEEKIRTWYKEALSNEPLIKKVVQNAL